MTVEVDKITQGNTDYPIADATAREALLNKVAKSGDTMTGNLVMDNGASHFVIVPDYDEESVPSSTIQQSLLTVKDDASNDVLELLYGVDTSGKSIITLMLHKYAQIPNTADYSWQDFVLLYFTLDHTRNVSTSGILGMFNQIMENCNDIFPVSMGGTGLSASPSLLTNLASSSEADVLQASPRPGVTGVLPVAKGGTGGTDSGWESLTNAAAFTGTIYYRKVGKWVEVCSTSLTLVSALSGTSGTTLGTLDSGYRPDKELSFPFSSTWLHGMVTISTGGVIKVYKNRDIASMSTSMGFYISTMFFIA